ncbi:hypothetical protein BSIN_3865 [Burkholderia singularis]|uniref:Uncharacterized protein n=1 Tax=Burkholderia singularis TaxID=1503053 RepID=A0A238H6M3_9BURK|nr:hypothetical protein BSIN_3865 [Burkholderia singularis]
MVRIVGHKGNAAGAMAAGRVAKGAIGKIAGRRGARSDARGVRSRVFRDD